jgi:hypothetical protein
LGGIQPCRFALNQTPNPIFAQQGQTRHLLKQSCYIAKGEAVGPEQRAAAQRLRKAGAGQMDFLAFFIAQARTRQEAVPLTVCKIGAIPSWKKPNLQTVRGTATT